MTTTDTNSPIFDIDRDQKEFLTKVGAECGLDKASMLTSWEYTAFAAILDIAEHPDRPYNIIQIPFIGKILFKPSKDEPGQYDTFLSLNSSFKELAAKAKEGNLEDIIRFYSDHFIKTTVKCLEQQAL